MNDYLEQLEAAIRATVIHSPTTYSWFGRRSPELRSPIKRKLTRKTARSHLLSTLQYQLYADFYCQGLAAPSRYQRADSPVVSMTSFVDELSAANCGSGYWDPGWEVLATKDSTIVVCRKGLDLWVQPEDCLIQEGESVAPGMRLHLRLPKESLAISPGYYTAMSNEPLAVSGSSILVR